MVRSAILLAVLASIAAGACRGGDPPGTPADPTAAFEQRYGVRILTLRPSAAGTMIDLRYEVVDPVRARPFLEKGVKPELLDLATGARLPVPFSPRVGALRQHTEQPEAGRTYFVLFADPGRVLRSGSEVQLVLGDDRTGRLKVL